MTDMEVRRPGLVVLAAAGLAACSTSTGGVSGPSQSGEPTTSTAAGSNPSRPLGLPSVAPGDPCPVTPVTRRAGAPAASGDVLGNGPLGPVGYYFDRGTATLGLRPDDRKAAGDYAKKVRWLAFDYTGPVVIRAGRLDGAGEARVEFSYVGGSTDDGFVADVDARGRSQDFPALTHVAGPGCYAYQVDTAGSSYTVVFAAVLAS
jgi:hypothetical protein